MTSTHLAFDLGAGSGRAMLGTLADGRLDMEEVHRFPTPLRERGDRLTWDLEALWAEIRTGYEHARRRAPALASLSIDSWGCDYVPLDRHGVPLRDPYCYRDPRTAGMMARAQMAVPRRELYEVTGIQFMDANTLYQAQADRILEPDLTARTATRLMIADYFLHRFGGRAIAERTLASTSQLLDVRTGTWAMDVIRRLNLAPRTWPEIVPPGTPIGRTPAGVAVVAGCSHDTAAAVAAVPAAPDGPPWAYVSSGTWSLLGVERAEPLLTDAAFRANLTNEAGAAGTVRFLRNLTGLWVLQECQRAWRASGTAPSYDELMREAEAAPSPKAAVNLDDPCFAQRSDDMPDRIRSYCRDHALPALHTRGEMVRLILESLAQAYRRTLRMLEGTVGERLPVLHIVGGGARNELLCRMTADACGCTVVAGPAEATAIGNLLVQASAVGALPAGATIRDVVRASVALAEYTPAANEAENVIDEGPS